MWEPAAGLTWSTLARWAWATRHFAHLTQLVAAHIRLSTLTCDCRPCLTLGFATRVELTSLGLDLAPLDQLGAHRPSCTFSAIRCSANRSSTILSALPVPRQNPYARSDLRLDLTVSDGHDRDLWSLRLGVSDLDDRSGTAREIWELQGAVAGLEVSGWSTSA